jgi:hypothetical protein
MKKAQTPGLNTINDKKDQDVYTLNFSKTNTIRKLTKSKIE